ncbi:MAG: thymidine phosphorylase [Pseudomonadota bacterium]
MEAQRILGLLRAGKTPSEQDLQWFARGLGDGSVTDGQGAAFAMALCLRGLDTSATVALTRAMRDSGRVLDWDLPAPVVDKHSTGGLGDAVSLVLAPLLAACGLYAPMLSGRGLGHTGGTLDKLEAIPGLRTTMPEAQFRRITAEVGCAVAGAGEGIAPADARLYALRDETATVESLPLIVASILSKKLAGGAGALVLDVKGGTGAFMQSREEAQELADALVATAQEIGLPVRALITDMNQPVAPAIGNAVEIAEVLQVLRDPQPDQRLCQLTLALAGELMALAGAAPSAQEGARTALDKLHTGAAAEVLGRMIAAQGGPADFLDRAGVHLPDATVQRPVLAAEAGKIAVIDGRALGQVVVALGGGRTRAGASVDPAVGLSTVAGLGTPVDSRTPLAMIHAADEEAADAAEGAVRAAFQIAQIGVAPPLIHGRVG